MWAAPDPWAVNQPWPVRSKMELMIYECLANILQKDNVSKKRKRYGHKWAEETVTHFWPTDTPEKRQYRSKLLFDYLDHALIQCQQDIKKQGFCTAGIMGIWLQPAPVHPEWSQLLAPLVSEARIHPRSNEQMLDLVHPCWHAAERSNGKHGIVDAWIPSTWDCKQQRFTSLITNLHPQHTALYRRIEQVIVDVVPMFSQCLQATTLGSTWFDTVALYNQVLDVRDKLLGPENLQDEDTVEDQDEKFDNRSIVGEEIIRSTEFLPLWPNGWQILWNKDNQFVEQQTPTAITPSEPLKYLNQEFASLQLYVKLARIQLTPDNPTYQGGKWHVEGIAQEKIAATVLYYLDMQNVTPSFLEFRVPVENPTFYEQNDECGVKHVTGMTNEGVLVQKLGRIQTRVGHVLCFSNELQHRVESFTLQDPSKPGHRTFLVLWLVSPTSPVVGLECVDLPHSWLLQELLPWLYKEMAVLVVHYASKWTEQVLQHSLKRMMTHRAFVFDDLRNETRARTFELCEH